MNKKPIDFETSKKIMLNILICINDFCKKNNLKYSLTFGTLLGAVRHKGFIPWDDDIDIMMPRKDYQIFLETFNSSDYKVISCFNCKEYYLPFAKVYDIHTEKIESYPFVKKALFGIDIDVFPVDYISNEEDVEKLIKCENKMLDKYHYSLKRYTLKSCIKHPSNLFKKIFYEKHYNQISKKVYKPIADKFNGLYEKSVVIGTFSRRKAILNFDIFADVCYLEFEGKKYSCIKQFDLFLKEFYGDYMILPPLNKQISHHKNNIFYKEK